MELRLCEQSFNDTDSPENGFGKVYLDVLYFAGLEHSVRALLTHAGLGRCLADFVGG